MKTHPILTLDHRHYELPPGADTAALMNILSRARRVEYIAALPHAYERAPEPPVIEINHVDAAAVAQFQGARL